MISVIIPTYNASSTIVRTLESVRKQTYPGKFEIIVINDGSTDNSLQVINNYIAQNNNLNIKIIDKPNGGVSTARNAGMRMATGQYIALLDADDEWMPDKIERQMGIFERYPDIDFLGTNRNDEFFKKILWKRFQLLTKISPRFLLVKFIFVVPTIVFKAALLKDIGYFDETQKYAEEGNYFIRIANKYNCYLLNESLVITGGGKAHFGVSGLSGNIKEMEKGELKNLRYARSLNVINGLEYHLLKVFSILKYIRRVLIVKILR